MQLSPSHLSRTRAILQRPVVGSHRTVEFLDDIGSLLLLELYLALRLQINVPDFEGVQALVVHMSEILVVGV